MILRSARAAREDGRVRPSYGHGRYGVVPSRAPDIVAMSVLQIRLPHHTIGRRHPWRFPPNAASVVEQGDGHCGKTVVLVHHMAMVAMVSFHQERRTS